MRATAVANIGLRNKGDNAERKVRMGVSVPGRDQALTLADTEGVDETASATDSSAPSQGGGSIVTGLERQAGSGVEGGFGQQCDSQPRAKRQRTDTTRGGQTSSVSGSVHHSQNTQGQSESNMVGPETTINRGQQANNLSGFQLPLLPSRTIYTRALG